MSSDLDRQAAVIARAATYLGQWAAEWAERWPEDKLTPLGMGDLAIDLRALLPVGYVVAIREHGRWTENWDGELHATVEAARQSRHEAEAGGYEAVVTELRTVTA